MKYLPFALLCLPLLAADPAPPAASPPPRRLDRLEMLTAGFPRTLLFRYNRLEAWARDGLLDTHLRPFNGDTRKYAGEETELRPDWQAIMADFKRRHPRELSLLHANAEARAITIPEFHRKYFPGHWVYRPGEVLKADVGAADTIIQVTDEKLFSRNRFALRRGSAPAGTMLPSILLVALDEQGNRLWYESEYAQITATDPARNTLTVTRGQYFSSARTFRAGRVYVAPMHCEHWGGNIMWTLNKSAACPLDRRGESAADVSLREYREWCGPGGVAAHVDGIGFDVMYFSAKVPGWDLDNDGVIDNGIAADGRNFLLDGVYAFTKRLRAQMGPDFILTSDGWQWNKQRAAGTLDGIESEGLCAPSDGWRKYGQTLNAHAYWNLHHGSRHPFSYITGKLMHPDDVPLKPQLHRLGLATACVLGVAYGSTDDTHRQDGRPMIAEMHRGRAEETNWLGQPVGESVLLAQRAPDLFAGRAKPFSAEFAGGLQTENCRVSVTPDGELLVTGTAANPYQPMVIKLPSLRVSQGELALFFEALAIEPLTGYEHSDRIPRLVTVRAEGLPTYADQRGPRSFYNDFMGYMGTAGYTPICAYFRRAGQGGGVIGITLTFEHQGACRLRGLTAHNAPMAIAREFEKGIVLLNASEQPVVFNLHRALPGLRRDAGLWRIRADPEAYDRSPTARAMLEWNDGRREDPSRIELPRLEALFLAKSPQ